MTKYEVVELDHIFSAEFKLVQCRTAPSGRQSFAMQGPNGLVMQIDYYPEWQNRVSVHISRRSGK